MDLDKWVKSVCKYFFGTKYVELCVTYFSSLMFMFLLQDCSQMTLTVDPKNELHLNFPHKITPESNINIMGIDYILKVSWLLSKFSLSAL